MEGVPTGEREWSGVASWYGAEYHGRPTASGEIYDMYELTAAHLTLPFGSQVQVTHLENGRTVRLRINDRGPFIEGRIVDLSYGAAQALDMVAQGVAPVKLELLPDQPSPERNGEEYTVQVGSFVSRENSERLKEALVRRYSQVYLTHRETASTTYHQVRVGHFASREAAEGMAMRLKGEGLPVFVTRVEAPPRKEK